MSSPTEHYLVTSNPAELADYADNGRALTARPPPLR